MLSRRGYEFFFEELNNLYYYKIEEFSTIYDRYSSLGYDLYTKEELFSLSEKVKEWYKTKYNGSLNDTQELNDTLSPKEKTFLEINSSNNTDNKIIVTNTLNYHFINTLTLDLLLDDDILIDNTIRAQMLVYDFCERYDRKNGSMGYIEELKVYMDEYEQNHFNNTLSKYKDEYTLKRTKL